MKQFNNIQCLFFGSTSDSVIVLSKLNAFGISCIVTQPPRPVGRNQVVTPTPVANWAVDHHIPVLTFPNRPDQPSLYKDDQTVIDAIQPFRPDIIISASYGIKIPTETINAARYGGLNVHPSLLPRWRGADPVPWAILSGDHQTGVSIVTLSERFDQGKIIAQKKVPITPKDFSDPLRTRLFTLGAQLLGEILPDYLAGELDGRPQYTSKGEALQKSPYARKFTREDGFEPWDILQKAMINEEEAQRIERKFRALTPWPGLWTTVNGKRLKILSCHFTGDKLMIDMVQLEGKKPAPYAQFATAYLSS